MHSLIAEIGGYFAILVYIHFASDWLLQSHNEAMAKGTDSGVRAQHCLVYSLCFIPFFLVARVESILILGFFLLLFLSHFIEDTYIPVMLWMKHIRKPPQFQREMTTYDNKMVNKELRAVPRPMTDKERFLAYLKESPALAYILTITVDQIIHIFFLLLIAYWMAM